LDFARKTFELCPTNTANFHFRPKRRERACREATRNAIFALRAKVFSETEKARGRAGAGSNQSFLENPESFRDFLALRIFRLGWRLLERQWQVRNAKKIHLQNCLN